MAKRKMYGKTGAVMKPGMSGMKMGGMSMATNRNIKTSSGPIMPGKLKQAHHKMAF